jgi:hypothetical protein
MRTISISTDDLKELKRLYKKSNPDEVFLFKGHQILREYAKYMIDHLEKQFGKENT